MFSRARWRLTLSFAGVLALIIVLIGAAFLYTGRRVLFDQVNDDLTARAERESRPLAERLLQQARNGGQLSGVNIGPAFTAGGYFYAVVGANGTFIASTANADPAGLADQASIEKALEDGPAFIDTDSSEGEQLRVYLVPLGQRQQPRFVMQVGRSTEPERDALRRLTFVLAAGGAAGVVLALGAGFWLAGRALSPIQTAMDRQRAFVADASHELRTPLSLIRANAEVLQRGRDAPVSANIASVDDIIAETDRLSGLVGQMLALARSDSGEAAFQMASIDLQALAEDTARQMRLLAEPKRIVLEVQPPTAAVHVLGDETRLRELITILLDNAIKYSDEGAGPVTVEIDRNGTLATLRVRDSGRGISTDALPRIFDRFYRADKARSRDLGGTGLGLAIAKWIVDAHMGTIAIESKPGNGTVITVGLPAA